MSRTSSKSKIDPRRSRGPSSSAEPEKVTQTQTQTHPQLAWKVLNEESIKQLKALSDVDRVAWKLADILSVYKHEECLKEAAQLDYYVAGYWYAARECGFTKEQTSAFFTILHTLLENIRRKNLSLGENLKELQAMVSSIGIPNVPTSLECFTTKNEIALILQYMQSTLFQHYALFQYLFSEDQEEEIVTTKLSYDVPNQDQLRFPFPLPLEEGIPMELYKRCMNQDKPAEPSVDSDKEVKEQVEESAAVEQALSETTCSSHQVDELEVSQDDLKALMEKITKTSLESFQTQMILKIKEREEVVVNRISKLEKTLKTH